MFEQYIGMPVSLVASERETFAQVVSIFPFVVMAVPENVFSCVVVVLSVQLALLLMPLLILLLADTAKGLLRGTEGEGLHLLLQVLPTVAGLLCVGLIAFSVANQFIGRLKLRALLLSAWDHTHAVGYCLAVITSLVLVHDGVWRTFGVMFLMVEVHADASNWGMRVPFAMLPWAYLFGVSNPWIFSRYCLLYPLGVILVCFLVYKKAFDRNIAVHGWHLPLPEYNCKCRCSVPSEFQCSITSELMKMPVVASDGCSYDEGDIYAYMTQKHVSPVTNELLEPVLVRNRNLQLAIQAWLKDHGCPSLPQ